MNYHFTKPLSGDFEEVLGTITSALQKEGFGIITSIDVKKTFQAKLGIEFKNYTILGACSPKHAYEALSMDDRYGVFLPCNVVVYEKANHVYVSIINPTAAASPIEDEQMKGLMEDVTTIMERVFNAL